MTALSESFYLMSIHNVFSWLISTLCSLVGSENPFLTGIPITLCIGFLFYWERYWVIYPMSGWVNIAMYVRDPVSAWYIFVFEYVSDSQFFRWDPLSMGVATRLQLLMLYLWSMDSIYSGFNSLRVPCWVSPLPEFQGLWMAWLCLFFDFVELLNSGFEFWFLLLAWANPHAVIHVCVYHHESSCRHIQNTPVLLLRGTNPNNLSFSLRSSCQTCAASGRPYRALFSLPTFPGTS